MAENAPATVAALDQLHALTSQHAEQVAAYYRTLVVGMVPVDTAAELAAALAKDLRRMAFHRD